MYSIVDNISFFTPTQLKSELVLGDFFSWNWSYW